MHKTEYKWKTKPMYEKMFLIMDYNTSFIKQHDLVDVLYNMFYKY